MSANKLPRSSSLRSVREKTHNLPRERETVEKNLKKKKKSIKKREERGESSKDEDGYRRKIREF